MKLEKLTIRAGGRTLLDAANAEMEAGRLTLIIGPSGVGKSLLLRVMAGLLPADQGDVQVAGRVTVSDRAVGHGRVGVVFQNFALFDELSAQGNVSFAAAHRRRRRQTTEARQQDRNQSRPSDWLDELNVPRDVKTAALSGGQRQRLAIARTLAAHPDVVVYDEPTSGLDQAAADRVAALIQRTQREHFTTSIVVTHDYRSLLPVADRVLLLDPIEKTLREVPPDRWDSLGEQLESLSHQASALSETPARRSWLGRLAGRAGDVLAGTGKIAEELIRAPISILPLWRSPLWGARYLLRFTNLVAGPSSWLYMGIAGAIAGFVATYFTFRFLPYSSYSKPLLIDDLLAAMGFSLFRILVPVLASVLIAARSGAAIASDIGSRRYGHQIDAMRTLRASPRRYLLTPILLAMIVSTPLLTLLSYAMASLTSLAAFTWTHPTRGPDYWQLYFHRDLILDGTWWFAGTPWLIAKLTLCGLGVGLIAYHRGLAPKYSSSDVSRSVTRTILWTTLLVLVVHLGFAFFEFD